MVHGGLGGAVGEGVEGRRLQPVDGADVDHPGRDVRGRLAQQGQELLGQEEDALDVGVHHLVPAHLGEGLDGRAPGGAGVVHQDVELVLLLRQPGGEGLDAAHLGQVGRQRDAGPAIGRSQSLSGGVADIGLARGDVDLGARGQEARGDHLANAARAAGDQGDLAPDGKDVVEARGHVSLPGVRPGWIPPGEMTSRRPFGSGMLVRGESRKGSDPGGQSGLQAGLQGIPEAEIRWKPSGTGGPPA